MTTVYAGSYGPEPVNSQGGTPLVRAVCSVFESDGTTLATLYTDRGRGGALANPIPTNVAIGVAGLDIAGNLVWFAEPDDYVLVIDVDGHERYRSPVRCPRDPDEPGGGGSGLPPFNAPRNPDSAYLVVQDTDGSGDPTGDPDWQNALDVVTAASALDQVNADPAGNPWTAAFSTWFLCDTTDGDVVCGASDIPPTGTRFRVTNLVGTHNATFPQADLVVPPGATVEVTYTGNGLVPESQYSPTTVTGIEAGASITVDATDPANPVVAFDPAEDVAFSGSVTAPDPTAVHQVDTMGARDAAVAAETADREAADALLIPLTQRGAANGVATLDSGGKVPSGQLPAVAINEVFVVTSQVAMLALAANVGDVAVRTDLTVSFMLQSLPASTLGNWVQISEPGQVVSVNGQQGIVTGLAEEADLVTEQTAREAGDTTNATAIATETGRAEGIEATLLIRLIPTAVKTGPYTLAANEFAPFDTTAGSVAALLPNAPADGTTVGLKQVVQGAGHVVTYATQGADVINRAGGATTGTLTLLAQGVVLQYKASAAVWYVVSDDIPLGQIDARYVLVTAEGAVNGVATLDGVQFVPASQLNPSWLRPNAAQAGSKAWVGALGKVVSAQGGQARMWRFTDSFGSDYQASWSGFDYQMHQKVNSLSLPIGYFSRSGFSHISGINNVWGLPGGTALPLTRGLCGYARQLAKRTTGADGHTTNNSKNITAADGAFTAADVGAFVTSTSGNVPAGTFIASVTNGTTAVLSANATGTVTTDTFTIGQAAQSAVLPVNPGVLQYGGAFTDWIRFQWLADAGCTATGLQLLVNGAVVATVDGTANGHLDYNPGGASGTPVYVESFGYAVTGAATTASVDSPYVGYLNQTGGYLPLDVSHTGAVVDFYNALTDLPYYLALWAPDAVVFCLGTNDQGNGAAHYAAQLNTLLATVNANVVPQGGAAPLPTVGQFVSYAVRNTTPTLWLSMQQADEAFCRANQGVLLDAYPAIGNIVGGTGVSVDTYTWTIDGVHPAGKAKQVFCSQMWEAFGTGILPYPLLGAQFPTLSAFVQPPASSTAVMVSGFEAEVQMANTARATVALPDLIVQLFFNVPYQIGQRLRIVQTAAPFAIIGPQTGQAITFDNGSPWSGGPGSVMECEVVDMTGTTIYWAVRHVGQANQIAGLASVISRNFVHV